MVKGLEEGDFANGCGGEPLVLVVKANLLDGNNIVGEFVSSLVDYPVGALSDLVDALVALHLVSA